MYIHVIMTATYVILLLEVHIAIDGFSMFNIICHNYNYIPSYIIIILRHTYNIQYTKLYMYRHYFLSIRFNVLIIFWCEACIS